MDVKYVIIIFTLITLTTERKVIVLDNEDWDSVTVTTSPLKITNSRFNRKNTTQDHAIRFDSNRVRARSRRDCADDDLKCLYDNQLPENNNGNHHETIDKFMEQYASVTNVKFNQDLRNGSRKSYWNQINAEQHKHPFDDAKGWVSLEPIPWSTSHVAKWKPHKDPEYRPWDHKPQSSSTFWTNNNFVKPEVPAVPTAQWGIGSNDIITDHKPNGFPLNDFPYQSHQHPSHTSSQQPMVPVPVPHGYQPPTRPQYQAPFRPQYQSQVQILQPANNYQSSSSQPNELSWQTGYNKYSPGNTNSNYADSSNHPAAHPSTYPSENNGEWVLLSTTKGYSLPQRFHDRKLQVKQNLEGMAGKEPEIVSRSFKSKYQEKDLRDEMTENTSEEENQKVWNVDGINILHTGKSNRREGKINAYEEETQNPSEQTTFKRTVRLTVLPPIGNTSTTSNDGLLEIDANHETVDEAQQVEERLKKLQKLAIVNTGRQSYHIVPVVNNDQSNDLQKRRAAVLAAVGAGMIPATMAVLLPVALGRKRRSINDNLKNDNPFRIFER